MWFVQTSPPLIRPLSLVLLPMQHTRDESQRRWSFECHLFLVVHHGPNEVHWCHSRHHRHHLDHWYYLLLPESIHWEEAATVGEGAEEGRKVCWRTVAIKENRWGAGNVSAKNRGRNVEGSVAEKTVIPTTKESEHIIAHHKKRAVSTLGRLRSERGDRDVESSLRLLRRWWGRYWRFES